VVDSVKNCQTGAAANLSRCHLQLIFRDPESRAAVRALGD
jgi:hypothetical protein